MQDSKTSEMKPNILYYFKSQNCEAVQKKKKKKDLQNVFI